MSPAFALLLPVFGCVGTAVQTDPSVPSAASFPTDARADGAGAPPPEETDEEQSIPADAYGARGTSVTMEPLERVRFVAIGDAGKGTPTQYDVADGMERVCNLRGCDFALYLGDVFYDTGVNAIDDPQFEASFELPYANLDFPFWIVLGNHDYGGGGSGYEFWKGNYYIEYSDISSRWRFPDLFYQVDYGLLDLFGLDTNAMMWGFYDDQEAWLNAKVEESDATWTIAYGHHPYLSNGPHGNAGEYDGGAPNPIWDGSNVKGFFDRSVCDKIDIYLCGHDHSLQWLESTCGSTELVVSGAGASATGIYGDNPVYFEYDNEGFAYVELTETTFTTTFYDAGGRELYSRTVTK